MFLCPYIIFEKGDSMDGVIVINKEKDMTSHDVVAKLRRILGTKKIGHTGTLDPLATGVLVACVNKATKLVQYLTCDEKIYEVEMKFGIKTDTGDVTGNVIATGNSNIEFEMIKKVLKDFVGLQKQIPPMYSAIKINGRKLYEYAREGIEIEREARDIEIYSIDNVTFEDDILKYKIHCSKGTYIRTVCEDIAERLGTVATMTSLNRVQSGTFKINQAVKLEDASEDKIISLEELFEDEIVLKNDVNKLLNGIALNYDLKDGMYKLYVVENDIKKFIGLGMIKNKYLYREIIL